MVLSQLRYLSDNKEDGQAQSDRPLSGSLRLGESQSVVIIMVVLVSIPVVLIVIFLRTGGGTEDVNRRVGYLDSVALSCGNQHRFAEFAEIVTCREQTCVAACVTNGPAACQFNPSVGQVGNRDIVGIISLGGELLSGTSA